MTIPLFRGVYIALLLEATAATLVWIGWRLGELAMVWAAGF